MRKIQRILAAWLALLFVLAASAASGEAPTLRGYDKQLKYQYITFGAYPTEKDGTRAPVLWRVLGVEDGVACLMTEHIVDFLQYHEVKDRDAENPLQYADTLIRRTLNEQSVGEMFTPLEQVCLIEMEDGRGLLSVPTRKELHQVAYGFKNANYTVDKRRQARGTPYAYKRGLKVIGETGNSWYWTTEWRRAGYRWIVGDNGHISCSGINRGGGLRAICYVEVEELRVLGGTGTREAPLKLAAREAIAP